MSLVLPDWVAHISTDAEDKDRRKPTTIFSLHVHPDGSRLATGGIDQKIRIWATEPILDPKVEQMQGAHRLLSTLSRHAGAVISVRFSPSGRYLASGSDDTVCLVWEFDPHGAGGGGSFGSSEQNVESWRIHRRLTGHESDVVDIAWSADSEDSYLATVGLDSVVNIWSGPCQDGSRPGCERIRRIAGHEGFVKGVVWDPLGRYLATQSDDKTLKLWRTSDWSCAKVITEPFQNSPSSNFFGRPSWSPDGAHIVAANAMNGPVFTANIIERKTWDTDLKLVGHEDSVVVTAFSPRLFAHPDGNPDSPLATVLALGSRDQSISIWITGKPRPLLVLRDVFARQVTDLSWSQDGLTLYASSTAGNVAVISLTAADVAEPKPLSMSYARKPNPQNVTAIGGGSGGAALATLPGTAQRPNVLQPRKAGVPQPPRAVSAAGSPAAVPPPATGSALSGVPGPANARAGGERLPQQIEITANGKRRIRPTLMGGQQEAAAPAASGSAMDIDPPQSIVSASNHVAQPQQQPPQQQQQLAAPQTVVAPQMPVTSGQAMTYPNALPPGYTQWPPGPTYIIREGAPGPLIYEDDAPFEPALAVSRLGRGRGREGRVIGNELVREAAGPIVYMRPNQEADPVAFGRATAQALPLPGVLNVLRREGEVGGTVEVKNYFTESADGQPSRPVEVSLLDSDSSSGGGSGTTGSTAAGNGKIQWVDFLPRYVVRASLSVPYLALALDDGTIFVYTKTGRRILTMTLDSCVCFMETRGVFLMALTTSGLLYRWNIKEDKELHRPISCLSLLTRADEVHQVYLHHNGAPILVLKSEQAWTVDPHKCVWTMLASGWFADCSPIWDGRGRGRGATTSSSGPVTSGTAPATAVGAAAAAAGPLGASSPLAASASSSTSTGRVVSTDSSGRWREPIRALENEINSLVVARSVEHKAALRPPPEDTVRVKEFELSATLRHLELRMSGAVLLNSKEEWHHALRSYAKKLGEEGLKGLAEETIKELLGPIYYQIPNDASGSTPWNPTIFDVPKRNYCREVLQILSKSPRLSGLASTYQELLKQMV